MWCYCQYKVSGINPFCCNIIISNTVRRIKNMKWKHLAIMFIVILLLFGCSSYNNKNTDESRGTTDKTIEKTRYNEDGKLERNNRILLEKHEIIQILLIKFRTVIVTVTTVLLTTVKMSMMFQKKLPIASWMKLPKSTVHMY